MPSELGWHNWQVHPNTGILYSIDWDRRVVIIPSFRMRKYWWNAYLRQGD